MNRTFTNLGGEVFKDGGEVDRGAGADALSITALLEVPGDPADGELEAGLVRPGDRLGGGFLASAALGRCVGRTHFFRRRD